MLRTGESEKEILLGNKQLLGVFFVIAILLGAAFTGGYMVGRNAARNTNAPGDDAGASAGARSPSAIETHSIPADAGSSETRSAGKEAASSSPSARQRQLRGSETADDTPPLGSRHANPAKTPSKEPAAEAESPSEDFNPHSGQEFLQVVAVGRDEAEAIADVLKRKGFRAHAVPKPGNSKIYRVLVGPIRDAGDLSNTRDSLRRTGFREVIVQRY